MTPKACKGCDYLDSTSIGVEHSVTQKFHLLEIPWCKKFNKKPEADEKCDFNTSKYRLH